MPNRYSWVDLDKILMQQRGENWGSFRERLQENEGVLGCTAWNAIAAKTILGWKPIPHLRPTPLWLYLTGPVGSGKTTLSCGALMSALREITHCSQRENLSGLSVRWMATSELWESLKQERSAKRRQSLLVEIATTKILVLDDLGAIEGTTPWHRNAMETIVVTRYNYQLPTIFTSNLRLDSSDHDDLTIAKLFGERVVSRIVECIGPRRGGRSQGYLEIAGMDWRADLPHRKVDRAISPSIEPPQEVEQLDLWGDQDDR